MRRENRKTLAWLDTPHRIAPLTVERLRALITSWPTPTATLVPTHGDWKPRNWLVDDDGVVSVIDFGRAALRPAMTDLAGLEAQQFRGHPDPERSFLDGYGADPRESPAWLRTLVREAVSTAAWAHQVGDKSSRRRDCAWWTTPSRPDFAVLIRVRAAARVRPVGAPGAKRRHCHGLAC
jgi:Ser/Thr protein kinase RdoA (MazF antagonist)